MRNEDRHLQDLLDVVEDLMAVPELLFLDQYEMCEDTMEVLAKARVIRAGILDEMAELGGAA